MPLGPIELSDDEGDAVEGDEELAAVEQELEEVAANIEQLLARQQVLQHRRDSLQRLLAVERRAPKRNWTGAFEWDANVLHILKERFGLQSFRHMQQEVINATMQGRDVLCLMPSGGGKSLTYQLPALLSEGITLVVSPLLSLITDQCLNLEQLGIPAISLTSLTPKEEIGEVYKQIESDSNLRLVYVTPERIVSAKRFMAKLEKLYRAGRLARIAVDEAHCCSAWGNDFRPDYKKLGVLKQQFPDVPILALTATATDQVRQDLTNILGIVGTEVFRSNVDRPNLFYEVREKPPDGPALAEEIAEWIKKRYPREAGIVYALTRKECETLAAHLRAQGISCLHYHADMDPAERERAHQQWSAGRVQVICATIAFGMGINKPDVRFVVHSSISKSVENYYQESGRAGRDGKQAHCLLFYRFGDHLRQATIVSYEPNWRTHLNAISHYASSRKSCRRSIISRHFGEAPAQCGRMCDICISGPPSLLNVTTAARTVCRTLSDLPTAEKRATLIQLLDKARLSKVNGKTTQEKSLSPADAERLIGHMVAEGYLDLELGYTAYSTNAYLKCGRMAPRLLEGRGEVFLEAVSEGVTVGAFRANGGADGACQVASVEEEKQHGEVGKEPTTYVELESDEEDVFVEPQKKRTKTFKGRTVTC